MSLKSGAHNQTIGMDNENPNITKSFDIQQGKDEGPAEQVERPDKKILWIEFR